MRKTFIFFLFGTLLAVLIFGLFRPWGAKLQLERYTERLLQPFVPHSLSVGKAHLIFSLRPMLMMQDVELRHVETQEKLFTAKSLKIPLSFPHLGKREWALGPVELDDGEVWLKLRSDGWNWSIPPSLAKTAGQSWLMREVNFLYMPWRVRFVLFRAQKLKIQFRDSTQQPAYDLKGVIPEAVFKKRNKDDPWRFEIKTVTTSSFSQELWIEGEYNARQDTLLTRIHTEDGKSVLRVDISRLKKAPRVQASLNIFQLPIKELLLYPGASESLSGTLTAQIQGTGEGLHPKRLLATLNAKGAADIREGFWRGDNFIYESVRGLSESSGKSEDFGMHLLMPFESLSNPKQVPFDILKLSIRIYQGRFFAERIHMKHTDYFLEADGSVGFEEKDVDIRARLVLMESVSDQFTSLAAPYNLLKTETGRMVIPIRYRGFMPGVRFVLDRDWVNANLASARTLPPMAGQPQMNKMIIAE